MIDHDNDRNYRNFDRGGTGGGTIAMLALGGLLVVGGVIYAMSGLGNQSTSNTGGTAATQSPATTGTGGGHAPASSGNASRP
jgi:hypothetical protein